jgi:hypothetical protein
MMYCLNRGLLSVLLLSGKVIPLLKTGGWYPQQMLTYLTGAYHILISYRSRGQEVLIPYKNQPTCNSLVGSKFCVIL